MTNHWIDIRNSDCILAMGSNPAENHPISFKWVTKAIDNGATLISVDPRYTRTSAKAHIHAKLRSGTDIAFLGGMMKYILDNDLIQREYVAEYTNASILINDGFGFKDGLFSGYDPNKRKYDKSTWQYQLDASGIPKMDKTLKHPQCVYQLLKKHYSRYDMDTVSSITGTPKENLEKVYKAYAATGKPDKAGTIMYAMGWTQHTVGVQNIRSMAMIQLLLGNIGVAGGGVNALRRESNVPGSTDPCLLFHILPGYLKTPRASLPTLDAYNTKFTPKTKDPKSANWWGNYPKYSVSLLKAFFGASAKKENDFGYSWLPKLDDGQNASWLMLFDQMSKGKFTGFFAWGQNPACSGSNAGKVRKALANLDWMVNVNIFPSETGWFFQGPGKDPSKIKTEVFVLPCACFHEKEGSITNSGRWSQWRYKAVNPPGEAMPDAEIMTELFYKVRELYKKEGGAFPDPILNLTWDYGPKGPDGKLLHVSTHAIAKEINGYFLEDVEIKGKKYAKGSLVPSFAFLKDDGTTSSGNWLYCNSYTEKGNMAARRNNKDNPQGVGLHNNWSWCWPVNRRIIYNRASVNPSGVPWAMKKPVIYWNGSKWVGDVPDGGWPPGSKHPFIMKPEGYARIFGFGLADGPFPEHYEPLECPVEKNVMSSQRINPTVKLMSTAGEGEGADKFATCDVRYPIVGTTYRVSEHWQTGVMTRWTPWLLELEPQLFVEMSEELAKEKGIANGEKVRVKSARGEVIAVSIVTGRLRPFNIMGKVVHLVGLPWHYGWLYPEDGGDSAHLLTPTIGDPNTLIPETKAFMVNVEKIGKGVK